MGQPGAKPSKRTGSKAIFTREATRSGRLSACDGSGKCFPFRIVVANRMMGSALPDYTAPRAEPGQTRRHALVYPRDAIERQ